jgi:mono/diheme cytochrome c family protein
MRITALQCVAWGGKQPSFSEEQVMRMFMSFQVIAVLLASTLVAYGADANHGLALAKRWCASCHLVSPEQQRANADAPPFATVARAPGFDARQLAYFLLNPHPKMPDLPLSRTAADDIAAYIASLKK